MSIGIFGGSFDPVHLGHLLIAEQALNQANLERLIFVPAAIPPHKQEQQLSSPEARVQMLRLAIGGHPKFEVDECELKRTGISYTVDTLREFCTRYPDDQLYFLMGADSLAEFHTWKDPQEICKLAIPLIVERPNAPPVDYRLLADYADAARLKEIQSAAIRSLQIEISSTAIRNLARDGKSFRFQTPRAVEQFIIEKRVYESKSQSK